VWNDERPPVPGLFKFFPFLWTIVYLTPLLLLPAIGNDAVKPVFLSLAAFVIARTLFAVVNNRESTRFSGMTFSGLIRCIKDWLIETYKDFWLRGFFKLLLLLLAWIATLIPILNHPVPWMIPVAEIDESRTGVGIPIVLYFLVSFVFIVRWVTYLRTLMAARSAGYANTKQLILHYCVVPAFGILLLHVNELYTYGGFVIEDFQSKIPIWIGGFLAFISE
jgi:hypothetical protein